MTNSYIAFAGGIMSFIGLIIILNYAEDRTFFAFQGMILGAVFLGLGVVVIAISAIVTDNKKSLYFCKHCKFAAAGLADLYNHSVKEHDDDDVEGIKKEFEDELNDELASWEERVKNLPKEPDEKLEEVEKLKTRNPYKAKGVIIGLIFVILFIPFFIVGGYFVANITFMVTDKMSPLIEENDWVHKSDTPISEINYNDIIFYTSSDKLMVNKVVGIIADERVDYIFTVKNTASPTIKKVTENQYVGKMDFIVGNFGEYGKIMLIILNFIFFPQMIILLSAIGFIVPIIVMRHRAKINV
ncbi:MAG: hypothetical protein HOB51_04265 [Thaumarchaeota archaeon]|nr:hypothetical protein [Nitrososphaerota archaeon]